MVDAGNKKIRSIALTTGAVTTLVGSSSGFADGTGTDARFNPGGGVVFTPDGSTAIVGDSENQRIRVIGFAAL